MAKSSAKQKQGKKRIDDDALIASIAAPDKFLETCTSLDGHPDGERNHLYTYQRDLVLFKGKFFSRVKSRQIGISAAYADRAFARSILWKWHRGKTPPLTVFVSWSLGDDKEKMVYVRRLYESSPKEIRRPLKTDNTLEVEFDNGARILCMHRPIGKGPADVLVDEAAFLRNWQEVRRGVFGMITRGGCAAICGTPTAKTGWLWDIYNPEREAPLDGWDLGSLSWYLCPDLCMNVRAATTAVSVGDDMDDIIRRFGTESIKAIRSGLPKADFHREYVCKFSEITGNWFPWELLLDAVPYETEMGLSLQDVANRAKGPLHCGYDVGRTTNASEFAVWEDVPDGRFTFRLGITLQNTPFDKQLEFLHNAMGILKPVTLEIDSNGIGMHIAENMERDFIGIAHGRRPDMAWHEKICTIIKAKLEEPESRRLALSSDRARLAQWASIEAEWTKLGRQLFSCPEGLPHHADQFWADAHAISTALIEQVVAPMCFTESDLDAEDEKGQNATREQEDDSEDEKSPVWITGGGGR